MATIQSTKPGDIAGSSVLTGRTPSYRLVLKVDPKTGQYKYEYEVDDKPKAVDAVTTTQAASAADDTKKDEDTKKDDTTTKDDTAQTSFEQTKAALGGGDGRDRQRNITTDDRNFGQIALDSTTARRRNLGLGAINPVFGLLGTVKSMDDRRRLKELGISTSTSREQIADVYSKAIAAGKTPEEALREASITGGVALTDKAFEDAGISGLSINDQLRDFQAKQTTTSTGTASDIPAEDRFKKSAFDQTVDAFGTDVSTTTEATKNVVGSSLDDKIRELENKLVGKKGKTKTRLQQQLNSLLDQKAELEAPTKVFTGTAKQQLQKKGPFDLVSQESVTPTKRPETATVADNRATISTARENLERAIQSNNIGAAVDAAKTAAGFSGMSRDAAQREMDKAANNASSYGNAKTGTDKRGVENIGRNEDGTAQKGSVAAERDKVGKQEAAKGRKVDRNSAVGNKARSNEVSDKNGNAVTDGKGKAVNFGGNKKGKDNDGGKGECFLAGTMISMADGSKKEVEKIDLGDVVEVGGKVFATGKFLTEDLHDYKGIKVSGSHMVNENNKWIRVADSKYSKLVDNNEHTVYVFGSENRRIVIDDILFTDYFEVYEQEKLIENENDFFNNWHAYGSNRSQENVKVINAG